MTPLRNFQTQLYNDIVGAWNSGAANVLAVSATGSGKTVVMSRVMADYPRPSCAIAHRRELVSQISVALARNGVRHRIIGPDSNAKQIVQLHMAEVGRNFIDPRAPAAVAGVDTLIGMNAADPWFRSVGLWVQDEGHHLLAGNKWGKAAAMFPNARGLAFTATPTRADGKGLGRHADGLIDAMVQAPSMRPLIGMGYLTDYRLIAPPSDIDLSDVTVGDSGEYSQAKLSKAMRKSRIVGDVVASYLQHAAGKLGVTFATDIEAATDIAAAFRQAGVPAEVVSSKTPDLLRSSILRRFKNRELLQLVNVDLFGEGFDLPAIEVVSMARPTMSFSLFCQQFGRALRLMLDTSQWEAMTPEQRRAAIAGSLKPWALIIDHVGNWIRHGLPDKRREWTLDRRERRSSTTAPSPLRACPACSGVYERVLGACPDCGHVTVPAERSSPEMVAGDLVMLDPEVLTRLRGDVESAASDWVPIPRDASDLVATAVRNRHAAAKGAREVLGRYMAHWCGHWHQQGRDDREIQRRFYAAFGVDVLTAQTLARAESEALTGRIAEDLRGLLKYG